MTRAAADELTIVRHVYVHVPFCTRRCSYCDFSIAVRRDVPVSEFVDSIVAEARIRLAGRAAPAPETLYFGGGTPTKLGPAGVADLVGRLADSGLAPSPGGEVTVEANPEDVDARSAEAWLNAGVNRLSIGVQSFAGPVLEWMHRTHTAGQAAGALVAARDAGFSNLSMDLIYALPDRLDRRWLDDVARAIDIGPDHLSLYGLTVEPHTPLGRWTARGTEVVPEDDRAAEEFLKADLALVSAGYEHYEVSNYARAGKRSRHNSAYWRRVPYLGLGPSAHSFDGSVRRWNVAAYAAWQHALARAEDPVAGEERLDAGQVAAERRYLGLRTDAGTDLTSADHLARADRWVAAGWAVRDGACTQLTPEGWLRLDALAAELM